MDITRIDQFAPTVAVGDGVTNSLMFVRDLLRELGYQSDIYSFSIPAQLAGTILHAGQFRDETDTLLLYHHSMGHDHGSWLLSLGCAKALVYHNITPAEFFPLDSGLRRYSELGRKQLVDWQKAFVGALAVSPLNQAELQAARYERSATIPLLVDSQRLEGPSKAPQFAINLGPDAPFHLSVGRIAENKRQHLLIEAFYHLLQLQKEHPQLTVGYLLLVGGTTSEDYARGLAHHISQLGLEGRVVLTGKCSDDELRWLYRHARQYWCASAHEGFCMPLLEANHADLPVVACAQSNIPDTLGEGGLLVTSDDPVEFAVTSYSLGSDAELQGKVVAAGKRNLQRYERELLRQQLASWIQKLKPAMAQRDLN